jgi:hypothetical protein
VPASLNTLGSAVFAGAAASCLGPHAVSATLSTNTNTSTNANDFFIEIPPRFYLLAFPLNEM